MPTAPDFIPIREASAADVPAIMELIGPFVAERSLLPRTMEELQRLTENGFAVEVDSRMIGFAAVEIYSRKLAEIQCLAVAREFQGRGIGKRLIHCCVERAKSRGVLELMAITASERLFASCGFDYSLPDQKRALFKRTT